MEISNEKLASLTFHIGRLMRG